MFFVQKISACCRLSNPDSSDKKCVNFEVFNFARDLFAAFCGVLVRIYLNYTFEYFSEFISNVRLSDEKSITIKIVNYASNFLDKFFHVNHWFFYEFFICSLKLMVVIVMLFVIINQNMDHIMEQKAL